MTVIRGYDADKHEAERIAQCWRDDGYSGVRIRERKLRVDGLWLVLYVVVSDAERPKR